ncbi:MAG: AmmeMemoRadiSam system protein B [Nitrospiraceae bacterium]|nr:MAG: AmmeMemoRadiSam system protein B [Nitrospiraceae bacterium]
MKRKPAVAGQFYQASPSGLEDQVNQYITKESSRVHSIGIVSPHAGLMYSGEVAGSVYSRITMPHTFILLGPNHTGAGAPVSVMTSGQWQLPNGEIAIDESLAAYLMKCTHVLTEDSRAHVMEHSLEVQLPFILHFSSSVHIVPIVMMTDSLQVCSDLGRAIADTVKNAGYAVTIIASSDMSHYVSDSHARTMDKKAVDKILALDPEGLYQTVREEAITMCGVIPVTSMLYAARLLGARESKLIKYMTSGEVSGDFEYVVGYAGLIIR